MVGLFINTLPLRMRLDPGLTLGELLTRTQAGQSALLAHQQIGLGEIQQAVGLGDLFDTLLVFENYPVDKAGLAEEADPACSWARSRAATPRYRAGNALWCSQASTSAAAAGLPAGPDRAG